MIIDGWDSEKDPLLTPGEVAKIFRVDPKTVTRWANNNLLSYIRLPKGKGGIPGHRRYFTSEIQRLLGNTPLPPNVEHPVP